MNGMTMSPDSALESTVAPLAGLFGILRDPTRLAILARLTQSEENVGSLCVAVGRPQPTISHHLGILLGGKLVCRRRAGKEVFYSLAEPGTVGGLAFVVGASAVRVELTSVDGDGPRGGAEG